MTNADHSTHSKPPSLYTLYTLEGIGRMTVGGESCTIAIDTRRKNEVEK